MKHNKIFLGFLIIASFVFSSVSFAQEEGEVNDHVAALRVAAEKGDSDAQFELGNAYQKGEGVRQDDTQAARWYQAAANQGNSDGQFALGFAYRGGFGVPRDEVQAYMWFNLAAAQGNEQALDMRSAVAELMTYDQISEARSKSREWKPTPFMKPSESP